MRRRDFLAGVGGSVAVAHGGASAAVFGACHWISLSGSADNYVATEGFGRGLSEEGYNDRNVKIEIPMG